MTQHHGLRQDQDDRFGRHVPHQLPRILPQFLDGRESFLMRIHRPHALEPRPSPGNTRRDHLNPATAGVDDRKMPRRQTDQFREIREMRQAGWWVHRGHDDYFSSSGEMYRMNSPVSEMIVAVTKMSR